MYTSGLTLPVDLPHFIRPFTELARFPTRPFISFFVLGVAAISSSSFLVVVYTISKCLRNWTFPSAISFVRALFRNLLSTESFSSAICTAGAIPDDPAPSLCTVCISISFVPFSPFSISKVLSKLICLFNSESI